MRPASSVWVAVRLLVTGFCWMTALYAFVTSSAFAYQQFIRPRVFPWLGTFSEWHAAACWAWLLLAAAAVWRDLEGRSGGRIMPAAFLAGAGVLVAWNMRHPTLPSLTAGDRSVLVGMVALVPILWLAGIDHARAHAFMRRQAGFARERDRLGHEGRLFAAAAVTAACVTGLYAALTSIWLAGAFEPDLRTGGLLVGLGRSFADHLLIFLFAFLLAAMAGRIVGKRFAPHYTALLAMLAALFTMLFLRLVGDNIGFDAATGGLAGNMAAAAAVMMGASIAGTWGGLRLRRLAAADVTMTSAFDVFFGRALDGKIALARGLPALGIVLMAYGLAAAAGPFDWNFILLKGGVVLVWVMAFAVIYRLTPPTPGVKPVTMALVCLAPVAAGAVGIAPAERHLLERYAVYNPSFRVTDAALRGTPSGSAFNRYLRANTGFTDVAIRPVSIDFVAGSKLAPAAVEPRPHIFLFVIDSLRPDYLSPYNPAVGFTPRIAGFAAESIVFRNAFTRYGGTGLSVPSIWAGSVIPHKQYVQPFQPMNALDKLLEANGYRKWLSLNAITAELLGRGASFDELDRGRPEMEFAFCRTAGEIERKLQISPPAQPIFVDLLPQDLHVARVRGGSVPAGESYPGFDAPYASRVHQIDGCFGAFVDTLKRLGLYDRSLIVLTADHGEHLGEDGRWGHSYYMTPEVIQVPLMVHLPARVPAAPAARAADPDAISFLTDITPTIYAALGYQPVAANAFMGNPLVGADADILRQRRRGSYVLAASYGAVYAVVRRNGHRLYIADAVNGGDRAYERGADGRWTELSMTDTTRMVNQLLIRRHIDALRELYRIS